MSNSYKQMPIINFKKRMFINNLSPLIHKQHFWLQYELVDSFFHFFNIIMLTKDQGIFIPTLLTEFPSNLHDTAIQIREK